MSPEKSGSTPIYYRKRKKRARPISWTEAVKFDKIIIIRAFKKSTPIFREKREKELYIGA
jgi:hypothetical protein